MRRVAACTVPATGVVPPLRTFAEVRAIAPVAGSPQKNGHTMLAIPWAISSVLASWRSSMSPSETTADRSDSIEPSRAIVIAGASRDRILSIETSGNVNGGRWEGIASGPKRVFDRGHAMRMRPPEKRDRGASRNCGDNDSREAFPAELGPEIDEESGRDPSQCGKRIRIRNVLGEPWDLFQEFPLEPAESPLIPRKSGIWLIMIEIAIPVVKPLKSQDMG